MIKFRMTIESNDDALAGPDGYAPELARIIRTIAHKVEDCETGGPIKDINGNKVGSWKVR